MIPYARPNRDANRDSISGMNELVAKIKALPPGKAEAYRVPHVRHGDCDWRLK